MAEGKPVKAQNAQVPVSENADIPMPEINKERVYADALAQYALIETAHTMRLINVTPVDVARQSKFLANEYIK
jgi:myo-inositol-1-phosphate synthase